MNYYIAKYDFPICNHTEGITSHNLGYTMGITSDGVPFEAEIFEGDESLILSVIMPDIYEDEKVEADTSNIIGFTYDVDYWDDSMLDYGMVDDGQIEDEKIVKKYVEFLENSDIISFSSNIYNGTVMRRVDIAGNKFVKVLVTLVDDENEWCYTNIPLIPFGKKSNLIDFKKKDSKKR